VKSLENFVGQASGRSTTGTYRDENGVIQTAAANVIRMDYSTGLPVILNELAAINYALNTATNAPGAANTTVATSTDVSALFAAAPVWKHTRTVTGGDSNTGALFPSSLPSGAAVRGSVWAWVPAALAAAGRTLSFTQEGSASGGIAGVADMTKTNQWQRISGNTTLNAGVTSWPIVARLNATSGDVFYTTCWQGEIDTGAATSFILAGSSPTVRAADANYSARGIFLDPAYTTLTPIFAGVSTPWFLTDTGLQIPLRDASYWLEKPIQSTYYLGTGTYEGTANLTGSPKPKTRGTVFNVTPVLIDPANLIYQYTDGPGSVTTLYEGGSANHTYQADTTNLYAGTTSAGNYRTDNSRGLFQLGSSPAANITVDCKGNFPVAGLVLNPASIAQYLLSEDLAVPAANINTASFAAAASAYGYGGGVYFGPTDNVSGVDAVHRILSAFAAKLDPGRDGALRVLAIRAPAGSPVATYDPSDTVSVVPLPLPPNLSPPAYRVRVAYQHNYTVQTSGFLGSTSATQMQVLSVPDWYGIASASTVLASYARPNDLGPVGGALTLLWQAQAVANDLIALWGARRRTYSVTVPVSAGIVREIGDIVKVTWPLDDLAGGQIGMIVGDSFHSGDATITLTVLI
jgi:hypothetical protein